MWNWGNSDLTFAEYSGGFSILCEDIYKVLSFVRVLCFEAGESDFWIFLLLIDLLSSADAGFFDLL